MAVMRIVAALATMIAGTTAAAAQTITGPAPAPSRTDDAVRYRMMTLERVPDGGRDHDLAIVAQRRTYRLGSPPSAARNEARSLSHDGRARSRITSFRVADRFTIGDHLVADIGWRGYKVSNRNANAATDGNDRLAAHDWFLPRATLDYRPAADLSLSLGYHETMRAYEGAGSVGPLGLTRDGFDTLRQTLRPERSRQFRLDGHWQVRELRLSLGGFHAEARDTLGFADRSYVPVNRGSVALSGITVAAEHHVTPSLSWSARYRRANGRSLGALQEQEFGADAAWSRGDWRGTLGTSRSRATLSGANATTAPLRLEAAIGYTTTSIADRPLLLSARLTNPSRLASVRLLEDTGALRAADRARGMMLGATMIW
ncbi:TonB-dependent receptor [Sphingomonas sp. PB4P5]|uniref:TonB-dependent receptor n=1 Tax=Parasphingomonas puruogangriensis TaxID=3096155 RepID=UPI002FC79D1E